MGPEIWPCGQQDVSDLFCSHTHSHSHTHPQIHTPIYTHVCSCTLTHIYAHTQMHTPTQIHMLLHSHICAVPPLPPFSSFCYLQKWKDLPAITESPSSVQPSDLESSSQFSEASSSHLWSYSHCPFFPYSTPIVSLFFFFQHLH